MTAVNQYNHIYTVRMPSFTVIGIFLVLASCDAGTRRRRRNMYNDRPCGPGQHAILSASKKTVLSCEACPKNTYRPDTKHSMESCLGCEAGRVSSEDFTHCIGDICRAGTYGTRDATTCSPCEIGKYSLDGMFSCTQCESGRYNNVAGQGSCSGEKCPGGKYGLIGQIEKQHTSCRKCSAGTWSSAGSSQCAECSSGKYSWENSNTCISHDKCPRDMYYSTLPSTTSGKIACTKCMYYSDIYSVGYVFAAIVAGLNIMLYLYNRTKYCYVVIMIIPPSAWLLSLNFCNGKPSDGKAITSIVMNAFCIIPVINVIITAGKEQYKGYCTTRTTPTTTVTKNEIGTDMVAV